MVLTYGIPPHTVLLVRGANSLLQQNHVLRETLIDQPLLLLHVVLLTDDAVVAVHVVCIVL